MLLLKRNLKTTRLPCKLTAKHATLLATHFSKVHRFLTGLYLLRVAKTPTDGETFPKHWNNLLDLSRAIVSQLLGREPSKM